MKHIIIFLTLISLFWSCQKETCLSKDKGDYLTENTFLVNFDGAEKCWEFNPNGTIRVYPVEPFPIPFVEVWEWKWKTCEILEIWLVRHERITETSTEILESIPYHYAVVDLHIEAIEKHNGRVGLIYDPANAAFVSTRLNFLIKS